MVRNIWLGALEGMSSRRVTILLVSPRAIPPWDSAIASLAKSRLLLFTHPRVVKFFDGVSLLTMFRDYKKVVHLHENAFGNEVYYDYLSWLRKLGVKAYFIGDCDPDVNYRRAQFMLNCVLQGVASSNSYYILWCIGHTPFLPRAWQVRNKVFIENFTWGHGNAILDFVARMYVHVATSMTIYRMLKKCFHSVIYLPPAIDVKVFSPRGFRRGTAIEWLESVVEDADVRLLYMGPLIRDRFPIEVIIPTLVKLRDIGYRPVLVALCTVRSGESLEYYKHVVNLIRRYDLERNLVIRLRVLISDFEKVLVYNSFDAILYIPIRGREMADPPITILEAMSCGLPPIVTPLGDMSYVVGEYSAGIVLHNLDSNALTKSILKVVNDKENLSKRARRIIETLYSVEAVAELARKIFTRILR